jgi:serine/threonine-protein kinase
MKLVENAVVAGKFRLNHMLGGGGMGSVWHATHMGLDIPCAVKFVRGELLDQDDIKSRFEREAKAAAQLRSPHVVQILDHGVCEGTPYIAMELLDGEDLGTRLERVGRLPPEQLHKIMSEACRALAKAHAQGIVHRDLKPDNIYLVRDDDREITKVLDFGIAKTRGSNEISGSGTKTGAMLGTPYYMSPEQAQGTKTVDFRSDLWSLAVITFQCITGRLPFESEALGDLLIKIIISPIPVPSQLASVPPGFDRWWAKASLRDPAERFQSAKEFSDSLALVCGVSHISGVIDREGLRVVAKANTVGGASTVRPPQGSQPWFDARPSAVPVVTTPATPGALSGQPALTAPAQTTPAPTPAAGTPARRPQATSLMSPSPTGSAVTPTPLSRSFAEGEKTPAAKTGLALALAFGGVLFISVVGGAGWFLFGRSNPLSSSSPSSTSTSAAAAPSPAAAASSAPALSATQLPPVVQDQPQAQAQAQDTGAPPPPAADVAAPTGGSPSPHRSSGGTGRPSATTAPTGTAKPAKGPKPVDMGF